MRLKYVSREDMKRNGIDEVRKGFWGSLKQRYMKPVAAAGITLSLGAAGCGARTGLINVYGDDAGYHPAPDAGVDAGQDADVDPPLPTNSFLNLIGDHLNKTLMDRAQNGPGENDSLYPIGGPDTSANANPFTDGAGGSIGPSEEYLYRIGPSVFDAMADVTVTDSVTGHTYKVRQSIWVKGDNHYDQKADGIAGRVDFLAYSLKFDGPDDQEAGIAVCKGGLGEGGACALPAYTSPERRRREISLLGRTWNIIRMKAPEVSLISSNKVVNGGSVTLAQEADGDILTTGQHLSYDGLRFINQGIKEIGGKDVMVLRVTDASGNEIVTKSLHPHQTLELETGSKSHLLHLNNLGPDWADLSILSKTLELHDGERVNIDEGDNRGFTVALGWKKINASASSDRPDALRTIVLYSDDIESFSTSGRRILGPGDSVPILQSPAVWRLNYQGLDLTSDDYQSLSIRLRTSDSEIAEGRGPMMGSQQAACIIHAPHLLVRSGDEGPVFAVQRSDAAGELSDNEFYVALAKGAACDADANGSYETPLHPGTVFMKISPGDQNMGFSEYVALGVSVSYAGIGTGSGGFVGPGAFDITNGGIIHIETSLDVENGIPAGVGDNRIGDLLESTGTGNRMCTSPTCADFYIAIAERAGEGASHGFADYWIVGVAHSDSAADATLGFNSSAGGLTLTSDDRKLLYGHAVLAGPSLGAAGAGEFYSDGMSGPVFSGTEMAEEGHVSERGSRLLSMSSGELQLSMAQRLGRSVWNISVE
jgi:hypothetical protein